MIIKQPYSATCKSMATACLTWFSRRPLQIRGLPYCPRCYTTRKVDLNVSEVEGWAKESLSQRGMNRSWWVPDPRTGIYFPEGHERVVEDIPNGAATFTQTYWLRNVDNGVHTSNPHPHYPNQHQPSD